MSGYVVVASAGGADDHQALGAMNMALELCHQGYGVSVVLLEDGVTPTVQPEIIRRLVSLMRAGAHVFTRWNFKRDAGNRLASDRQVSEAVIAAHRAAGDIVIWPVA
jgi:CTP:molybdopterin cytidylyltransferase MocA